MLETASRSDYTTLALTRLAVTTKEECESPAADELFSGREVEIHS